MNANPKYSQTQKPNRPLRNDFTAYTLKHATVAKQRALHWRRLHIQRSVTLEKEQPSMKMMHKPIFAALTALAIISIGGTTYAAVNGGLSSITALFGGEHTIPGARIVKVDLENCHDHNVFNIVSGTGKGDTPRYYQIADSAHVTNQEMTAMAQDICRAAYDNPADQALMQSIENQPQNKGQLVGNAEGVITALTPSSIDIQVSPDASGNVPFTEHFTKLDANITILDGSGTPQSMSALHVGDHVYSQYRASGSALTASESTPLNQVDWSQQTLVVVTKQSPSEAAYDQYQKLVQSKKVQQVVPCHHSSTGYCTYDELKS